MAWLVRNAKNRWLAPVAPSLWTLDPGSRIGGWPLWPPVSGLWTHDPESVAGPSGPQSLDSGPRIQNWWLAPLAPSLWTLDPASRIGGWPLWPPVSGLWTLDPESVAGPSAPPWSMLLCCSGPTLRHHIYYIML